MDILKDTLVKTNPENLSAESLRLPNPWLSLFDLDKTIFKSSATELITAIHLLNIFARNDYNFYSTICTQRLCTQAPYTLVANLNWNINGKIVYPPLMLESGTVVAWAKPDRSGLENFTYTKAYGIDFKEYAEHERPQVIQIIKDLFPEMVSFEDNMVQIGAVLNERAIAKFGDGNQKLAKTKMKPILDQRLKNEGLSKLVITMSEGEDLDCVPAVVAERQKMIGISKFLEIIKNDSRYKEIAPLISYQRTILADDKNYAAGYPAKVLLNIGAGFILPMAAQETLIKGVINANKPKSYAQVKNSLANSVIKAAFMLALQKSVP